MFATVKQIFNPKNKDIQKRILFTLLVLFIFKLGTTIIVPGVDTSNFQDLGYFELLNVFGGGALEKFSILALGVMPYITASIVIQLLEMDIVPYLAELSKQGHTGRAKLNQITRVLGIVLAFINGYVFSFAFLKNGTPIEYMQFATVLTAGTAFLLWLGDQITAKGIGNGISLIIMAGIIANIPNMFAQAFETLVKIGTAQETTLGIISFIVYVLVYIGIIIGIVFIENAERRIPIQYANKSNAILGKQNYIPFKLNSPGVMPVIFASALMTLPSILASFIKKDGFTIFVSKWLTMNTATGFGLYIIFIIAFAYFYTFLQLKPKELAENLQKNGGFIPGIRPGEETVQYVSKILKKITLVGAIFLAILAALPIAFGMIFTTLPNSVTIGGTGILIVVGVALETYKQIESELVTRDYVKGRKRR